MPKRKRKAWWVQTQADKLALEQGCYWDQEAADLPCDFIEAFCCVTKGRKVGQPMRLLPWQRDLIQRLYGWKRADGTRRFRSAYIEIAKKNGKTALLGALVVFEILFGDLRGEIYLCAKTRKQARICFEDALAVVKASPQIGKRLSVHDYYNRIVNPKTGSKIEALSSEADSKDGYDCSFVVTDELHRFGNNTKLWDVFKYAGAAREQPINLAITTAGERGSLCWEQHQRALAILDGTDLDTSHLAIVYGADQADDLDDPKTWAKANPSLGVTLSQTDFRQELEQARKIPREFDLFKRLRLNLWLEHSSPWLPLDKWHAGKITLDAEKLRGRSCYAGLDLSRTIDLTSLVLVFPDDDGYTVLPYFFAPRENVEAREQTDEVPYRQWATAGHLILTEGSAVSYQSIRDKITELAEEYTIEQINVDPNDAGETMQVLQQQGFAVCQFPQYPRYYNYPCKQLEQLLLDDRIRHPGNKVLDWCAGNVVAKTDDRGYVMPDRKHSSKKIDGIVAMLMGLGGALGSKHTPQIDYRIIQL